MPVNGGATGFEVFSRYHYQYFVKSSECVEIIFDFSALYFGRKYVIITQQCEKIEIVLDNLCLRNLRP